MRGLGLPVPHIVARMHARIADALTGGAVAGPSQAAPETIPGQPGA